MKPNLTQTTQNDTSNNTKHRLTTQKSTRNTKEKHKHTTKDSSNTHKRTQTNKKRTQSGAQTGQKLTQPGANSTDQQQK